MKLHVLGSSSKGNCYVLSNDSEALILEMGVKFSEVVKALDYNVRKVAGCLVSHEHGDHASHVREAMEMRIPVYTTPSLAAQLGKAVGMQAKKTYKVGGFSVVALAAKHDVECYSFLIYHNDMGRLLFATDTSYLPFKVNGLNNIMIEANYVDSIIRKNVDNEVITPAHFKRVVLNHMSLETCIEALQANDLTHVNNIVLLHLSADNSCEEQIYSQVEKSARKRVFIAKKGLVIENFGVTPF